MSTTDYPAWDGVRPLDWYLLIHQAETIRARHHLGLASVWVHINRRDYAAARGVLDRVLGDIRGDLRGTRRYRGDVLVPDEPEPEPPPTPTPEEAAQ